MRVWALALLASVAGVARADTQCKLTQKAAMKPEPSLTQCYRFNTDSCCVSGHDAVIKEAFEEALSTNCLRRFPLLERWFCLGCDPESMQFVESAGANPVIRICKGFADSLYNSSLETCGIKMQVMNPLTLANPGAEWENGIHAPSVEAQVVIPKLVFSNSTAFLNSLLPPFFEGYTVQVVDDDSLCFSCAWRSATRSLIFPVLALFVFLSHL